MKEKNNLLKHYFLNKRKKLKQKKQTREQKLNKDSELGKLYRAMGI